MRKSLVLAGALIGLGVSPAAAADYVSTVEASNPLAYFRLTAPDLPSTNGNYTTSYTVTTGTSAGAPIAADPANTGATFLGDNAAPSEVRTGLTGGIPGKGSINLWVNLGQLPSAAGHFFALAGEAQSGNDLDFQIQTDNRLYFYTGSGENTSYTLDPASLVGQWHMLTATYDATQGTNSFRNLYVDGSEVATFTGVVNAASKTSQFNIGYNDVFTGRDFAGSIDEVAVWNYGLSAAQVSTIYNSSFEAAVPGVPEPASWALMIAGFTIVGGAQRRFRRADRVVCA